VPPSLSSNLCRQAYHRICRLRDREGRNGLEPVRIDGAACRLKTTTLWLSVAREAIRLCCTGRARLTHAAPTDFARRSMGRTVIDLKPILLA
jgi:hypothetical protein